MIDVTARIGRQLQIDHQAPKHCVFSSLAEAGHHLVKLQKMLFGKEFWQSLACFVTGGIITVILIKMLERKRDGNNEEQGGRRILIPVQEAGDGEREVERVVPAFTTNIRKFPQEQDEF